MVSGTYHAATSRRHTRTKPPITPPMMKFSANRAILPPRGFCKVCERHTSNPIPVRCFAAFAGLPPWAVPRGFHILPEGVVLPLRLLGFLVFRLQGGPSGGEFVHLGPEPLGGGQGYGVQAFQLPCRCFKQDDLALVPPAGIFSLSPDWR